MARDLTVLASVTPVGDGHLNNDLVSGLKTLKDEALRSGNDARFPVLGIDGVPGGILYLIPAENYGPYRTVLDNDQLAIAVSESPFLPNVLTLLSTPYSIGRDGSVLTEADIRPLHERFFDGGYELKVSRCTFCFEFQCSGFEIPKRRNIVTRSRKLEPLGGGTGTYGSYSGGLMWNLSRVDAKREDPTGSVGRKSGTYRPSLPVYRLELVFCRSLMRDLRSGDGKGVGISTPSQLYASLGDLLGVAFGDEHHEPWLRVATPESFGLKASERPDARWWKAFCQAARQGFPVSGRRRVTSKVPPQSENESPIGRLLALMGLRIAS